MKNIWFSYNFLSSVLIFFLISPHVFSQYDGKLGINLGGVHPYIWVDVVKSARAWEEPAGGPLKADKIDENGWPEADFRTVLMDHRPVMEWAGAIDDPEQYRIDVSGRYKGSFTGQADIVKIDGDWFMENVSYDAGANKTTFDLVIGSPGPDHGLVIMLFENTRRTQAAPLHSGITDLSIIRPGYDDASSGPFTDYFMSTLTDAGFSVIRSQNFTGTTSWDIKFSDQYHWQDRKSIGFAIQGSGLADKRESAAWEYFIDICNQANMDIWLNIPISAADDYVLGLAQLLRDSLKSNLNIYVENDNEVWNSAPAFVGTFDYNHDQAVSLGLTDEENITRRAHELAMLFSAVFGQGEINKRVRVILASHAPMLKWWVQPMLEYLNAHFGPPKDYIWGLSRQTYFRAKDAENSGIGQMLDAFMKNIKYQLTGDPVNSSGRLDWVRVAKEWQLPGGATSYEGGPDTPSGGSTDNLSNKIMLNRDPGMIQVMRYNLANNWWDIGGGLALHFTLFSHYTRYGAYGLTDDLYDPDRNYKFEALRHPVPVITRIEKEPDDIRFSVYPNPSKGIFYISSDIKRPVKITIFDVPGKEKLTTIMKNGIVAISTSGWDPGVYVILFGDENPDHASKILVQ